MDGAAILAGGVRTTAPKRKSASRLHPMPISIANLIHQAIDMDTFMTVRARSSHSSHLEVWIGGGLGEIHEQTESAPSIAERWLDEAICRIGDQCQNHAQ